MKIGDLSKHTGILPETIRYYEKEGLLPSNRSLENNYRLYGEEHMARLQFIKRCRTLDMTLQEIRTLLQFNDEEADNCQEVNALLDEHIEHVTSRIKELKQLEKQLKDLRHYCSCREERLNGGEKSHHDDSCLCKEDAPHCGILVKLFQKDPSIKMSSKNRKKYSHSHVK